MDDSNFKSINLQWADNTYSFEFNKAIIVGSIVIKR